jgi:hypothetical protein
MRPKKEYVADYADGDDVDLEAIEVNCVYKCSNNKIVYVNLVFEIIFCPIGLQYFK